MSRRPEDVMAMAKAHWEKIREQFARDGGELYTWEELQPLTRVRHLETMQAAYDALKDRGG